MVTLQEQFEKDYPDKGVDKVNIKEKYKNSDFTNRDLDLSEYKNLTDIYSSSGHLTSVDFLNTLSNPEKLKVLRIYNNNIQPTDISFFSKFVNLRILKIGTTNNE